jgi:hypothetical protein
MAAGSERYVARFSGPDLRALCRDLERADARALEDERLAAAVRAWDRPGDPDDGPFGDPAIGGPNGRPAYLERDSSHGAHCYSGTILVCGWPEFHHGRKAAHL